MNTPLLTTHDLSIGYPTQQRTVAQGLTLSLAAGQLVCLLGPNGAGKSTLMRTLAGLQTPLAGTVQLAGELLTDISTLDLARRMSLVLAERVDMGTMRVGELVALGRAPHTGRFGRLTAIDQARIEQALTLTNTNRLVDRRLHQLSDGERQTVMLARALAQDTDLILLDEPTAHLDLPNRVEMMRLLRQLTRQTGKAILLSTHELDLALQAADTLWLFDVRGQLTVGAPEDLVLTGAFDAAFDKAGFYFDRMTGTFTMQSDENGPAVRLSGNESLLFWTRRALHREGFAIQDTADRAVEAFFQQGQARWQCTHAGQIRTVTSVSDLLGMLSNPTPTPPR
jgi:iron complex transport system ATP-binding protein